MAWVGFKQDEKVARKVGAVKHHANELDLFHNTGETYEILLETVDRVILESNKLRERLLIALKRGRSG